MIRLDNLNFDNPNNACLSLRVLAERIRRGEVRLVEISPVLLSETKAGIMVDRAIGFQEAPFGRV